MMPISVSDASPTSSGATANLGGGNVFGSMGSGRHTTSTGMVLPSWAIPAAIGVALVAVLMRRKRRKG